MSNVVEKFINYIKGRVDDNNEEYSRLYHSVSVYIVDIPNSFCTFVVLAYSAVDAVIIASEIFKSYDINTITACKYNDFEYDIKFHGCFIWKNLNYRGMNFTITDFLIALNYEVG